MGLVFKLRKEQVVIEDVESHIIKNYIDQIYPINKGRYIQFPNDDGSWDVEEDPNIKFPDTLWETVFDDEGTFFRTEWGTENGEPVQIYDNDELKLYRIDGLSKSVNQRMTGDINMGDARSLILSTAGNWQGALTISSIYGPSSRPDGGAGAGYYGIRFENNLSPSARTTTNTAGRTEPQNRLMKIWLRTG